jgi:predicted aspartyl protease
MTWEDRMEIQTMGKVLVTARIENLKDLYNAERGNLPADQVRSVDIEDALVDTGAMILSLPKRWIEKLGLAQVRTRRVRTTAGLRECGIYEAVRLTIQGRDCIVEVADVPDDCPALIGQVPLEMLDFVVDPVGRKLIGNPEHGGEQMFDQF